MVVLSACIYSQTGKSCSAKCVVGEHTVYCDHHSLLRVLLHHFAVLGLLKTADPAGVPLVGLLLELSSCKNSFSAVDDDNVVAAVSVRSECGLVLATEDCSSLSSYTTEGLAGSTGNSYLFFTQH